MRTPDPFTVKVLIIRRKEARGIPLVSFNASVASETIDVRYQDPHR